MAKFYFCTSELVLCMRAAAGYGWHAIYILNTLYVIQQTWHITICMCAPQTRVNNMATSIELSPQNVVTALQDLSVEKTTELVFHLGVEIKVLDDIALQYSRKIHSIQAWLDSDTHASWRKLVSSLKQIGMAVAAKRVESTYVPQVEVPVTVCTSVPISSASIPPAQAVSSPAPLETGHVTPVSAAPIPASVQRSTPGLNPSQPSAVIMERVTGVKDAIEDEFAAIKADTHSSLTEESQNPKFLHRFRNHLLELPVAKKANSLTRMKMKYLVQRTLRGSSQSLAATATTPTMRSSSISSRSSVRLY